MGTAKSIVEDNSTPRAQLVAQESNGEILFDFGQLEHGSGKNFEYVAGIIVKEPTERQMDFELEFSEELKSFVKSYQILNNKGNNDKEFKVDIRFDIPQDVETGTYTGLLTIKVNKFFTKEIKTNLSIVAKKQKHPWEFFKHAPTEIVEDFNILQDTYSSVISD